MATLARLPGARSSGSHAREVAINQRAAGVAQLRTQADEPPAGCGVRREMDAIGEVVDPRAHAERPAWACQKRDDAAQRGRGEPDVDARARRGAGDGVAQAACRPTISLADRLDRPAMPGTDRRE